MSSTQPLARMRISALLRTDAAENAVLALGATVCAIALGYLTFEHRYLATIAAAASLLAAIAATNVARVAVVALVGVWVVKRAPGLDVSYTDILVAGSGAAAWAAGVGRTLRPGSRIVLGSFVAYLATLGMTLAYNHSVRSDFEWFHRVALVAGAIFVGAWLVREGLHRAALRLLLGVTAVVSVATVVDTLSSGLAPGQPFGYQKNFVGSIATTVLLVLLAAPQEFRLSARLLRIAGASTAAGLLASQSRGAMLAFAVGAGIWWFRQPSRASRPFRRAAVLLFAVALVAVVGSTVRDQLRKTDGRLATTSLTQRFDVERATRQLWIEHPYTGVGLRYFKTSTYAGYQAPNNVFNEILAEAGAPGLVGFVVFVVGSLVGLGRLRGDLATAALCVVAARFVHGLFDIYWTGGTTALPWMVAGMALAVSASQAGGEPVPPLSSRRRFPR